ncbi:type 1 fimbrial protein [Lelliottia aquatilis]|uniref:fimbrial protein n=1 Tax=Lelliottia aquatilis TaxID=2080838 RepID=UPI0015765120|nr:fimbrial protein [Lelliottia aquatilis]NTZ46193.1 type 1 fimbrial protein [Lelliottia aquatilis]
MHIIKTLLIGSLFISINCLAIPVVDQIYLNYSGTVVIPPCTISVPSAVVDFGTLPITDFTTSDSATDWKEVKINLTECADVSEYDVTINATPDSENNLYIANEGTAEHLAVQAKMEIPTVMPAYDGVTIPVRLALKETISQTAFDFRTRNNGSGAATAGSVKSVITLVYTFK